MVWWVVILLLAGVLFWASHICYRLVFYNLNQKEQDVYVVPPGEQYEKIADIMLAQIDELNHLPYEEITITALDGVNLVGKYYHFKDGAPVQIQFHGYRGNGIREFSGGFKIARELGLNSLVVDERAHGKSGGHTITFGILERYDCAQWVRYVSSRFGPDTPIILSGVSMGAATVLMASELDLPGKVVAITADCPYSSPGAIIRKVCRGMKLPVWLLYPLVALGALIYGKFCIWKSSAVKAVANTEIPIFIVHGEDDRFVPCEMSRHIAKSCAGPCTLLTIPDAGHGICYYVDTERYRSALIKFFRECRIIQ